jgi:CheY-like chemotaxis protein
MACVLVIEDNEEERHMYAALLRHNGFDVLQANEPISGMEIARTQHPDVILMDYLLPTMSGLLAAELLTAAEETADIPIVFITGYSVNEERFKASGCRELLNKPARIQDLVHAVRRQVEALPT